MMRVKSITHTLKYLFSNQPKTVPKPAPLEFDFKIPNKPQPSQPSSQSEVKITKAKRQADVSKLLKKKKQGEQYKAKIESSYQQQQQQKIVENLKTTKYHEEQYFKGEHLIENIPLDPFYSYKLADFERRMEMKKDRVKDFISGYTNFDLKAENKFKLAELYHQKQQKYEIQEFLRYLDEYPGSPKGPKPEDDLDFYVEYAYKKIPAVLVSKLSGKKAEDEDKFLKKSRSQLEGEKFTLPQETSFSSVLHMNRPLQQDTGKEITRDQRMHGMSQFSIFKEYEQIPELPELQFVNYHQYMKDYMNWKNFKNYYVQRCGEDIVKSEFEYLFDVETEKDPDPENEYFVPGGNTPSLLRYYKTLPKQIQDHPGIKDIVLGLEFLCPYISYQEKQQALNHACTLALPLEKLSIRAMSDFIEKKKEYLTPFMTEKIFSINPEFTWDIKEFFAQIKREQLKGQSMIKENEGSYPEPPQVHLEWEEGTANLPIDFYDNEDGFWDEIISAKLKRQDEAKPMMKVRKHFLH